MAEQTTRVLVVDDSALYRQTVKNVLRDMPETVFVGIAKDGVDALKEIEELDPDLLTLDVQMPDMDGIQVLKEIKRQRLRSKAKPELETVFWSKHESVGRSRVTIGNADRSRNVRRHLFQDRRLVFPQFTPPEVPVPIEHEWD